MFPTLIGDGHTRPILQLCLAALSRHADYLRRQLPATHPLLASYVFANVSVLANLRSKLYDHGATWMQTTGIPPHVELYRQQQQLQLAVSGLPSILLRGFETLLNEKMAQSTGITRQDLRAAIQSILSDAGLLQPNAEHAITPAIAIQPSPYIWRSDGKFHRLPEDFTFPAVDALGVWCLWWFGNAAKGYPPFRLLHSHDFKRQFRKTFSEWTMLVKHLVDAVERATSRPIQTPENEGQAHSLFRIAIEHVPMKAKQNEHKRRPERATTTLRRIREAIHDADPSARSVPFRHRKRQRK
ncbi:hypothetical protein PINS_up021301 [Pythium insidiosum]|nr:hypothetical protein PINS_up021301 [Pythium insidiosum]